MENVAAAQARREYKRNWARNNPDKVKAQQERYWAKRAAMAAEEKPEPAKAPAEASTEGAAE